MPGRKKSRFCAGLRKVLLSATVLLALTFSTLNIFAAIRSERRRLRTGSGGTDEAAADSSKITARHSTKSFDLETIKLERDASCPSSAVIIAVIYEVGDWTFLDRARSLWSNNDSCLTALFFCVSCSPQVPPYINVNASSMDSSAILQVLQYVKRVYDPDVVLRVSVRTIVNVRRLAVKLDQLCDVSGCGHLWAGSVAAGTAVSDASARALEHMNKTGTSTFLPHMRGEAYLLSRGVLDYLSFMQQRVGLKSFHSEDLAMASWLIPVLIRRIDLSDEFWLYSRYSSIQQVELTNMCSVESPLLISKVPSPAKMQALMNELAAC